MRKLLNMLYVTTPEAYLALDGENVVVLLGEEEAKRIPLHLLEGIAYFGYKGASPALMGALAERGIRLSFFTPNGRLLAAVAGENRGNVLLRRTQYRWADDEAISAQVARGFIFGKVYNSRWILERATRDHALRVDVERLKIASQRLAETLPQLLNTNSLESLRGLEGKTAEEYFNVLDELILRNKEDFFLKSRNRRPPKDRINALLSFGYTLLTHDCAAALESVGLDPYVGFLHRDRPGRMSLALDLMEELRAVMVDRFVLTAVNNRLIKPRDFETKENGAVLMNNDARKIFLNAWQERKRELIVHPYLNEKVAWGLVPYVQAQLLSRLMRADVDAYPSFLWK